MADNKVRNIAPFINDRFLVTSEFGEVRDYEKHPAMDLATSGKKNLYSILNGVVLSKGTSSSAGNWICIKDTNIASSEYGLATLYMHMDSLSPLSIGANVLKGDYVGVEGTTGVSTGVHLDIRMQNLRNKNSWNWNASFEEYLNPATFMGIDNIEGKWWIYEGTPTPPTPSRRNKKFKWVLYANNIRKR